MAWYERSRWALAAVCLLFAAPIALIPMLGARLYFTLDAPAYLVFHNVAEFFAVATSFAIFAVAWFTHEQTKDKHVLFLGCVFLVVGLVDLMHTLGYAGMPAFFTPNSANKSTQFWIAARVSSAAAFLGSAFVHPASRSPWLSRRLLLTAGLAFSAVVFTLVTFFPGHLPATFVPEVGLTPFKRGAEYATVTLLALAAITYLRRASRSGDALLAPYAAALAIYGLSEILFTVYRSAFDAYNVIGHVYKVVAFGIVFRAGFVASVQRPHRELLAKENALRREAAERAVAEAERRRTEGKFIAFAEAADQVFWITRRDPEAVIYVNPAFERVWGRPAADVYRDARAWVLAIHPEDREKVADVFARWLRGPADHPFDVQYRITRPDGETRWIADRGFVLEREGGEARLVAGIGRDVTEDRRAEDQFRQSQKLEAVGRLAGGLAHDFNNLLTVILGGCDVLTAALPPEDAAHREEVKEIEAAAHRAAALTRQLLSFSRRQLVQPKVLSLNEIVEGMFKMLRRLIGEDVELVTTFAASPGHVRADPGQIEQVIVNLAVNARDAMPTGGRLTIETFEVVLGARAAGPWYGNELTPGRYVTLAIGDTGCGMTAEILAHLFEPFFTTKEVGKGTGLGLSTVYGIVKQAGGGIRVQSTAGQGSRFEVLLPRVDEATAPVVEPKTSGVPRGTETVLLVEDDPLVRRLGAQALKGAGFSVLEAGNGEEALRVAAAAGTIDLLITDVVMPALGGVELAERLQRERPGMRVLFVTGYADRRVEQACADRRTCLQQKPFTPGVLLRRARELLDQATAPEARLGDG